MNCIFTTLACLFIFSFSIFSQGGNSCGTAVRALPGTNIATQGTPQYFQYVALQDRVVTLSACSATVNYTITVNEGCSSKVDTFMTNCSSGTKKQTTFFAEGGKSYIIRWNSDGNVSQTYNWSLAERDPVNGETIQNALTGQLGSSNQFNATGPLPVWYQYKATQDSRIEITTCGHTYAKSVKVYGSTNLTDSLEVFRNNYCSVDQDRVFFYAKQNQTYYIKWRNPTFISTLSFPWTLTEVVLSPGEECSNPLPLAIGTGANTSGGNYMRWYSYTNISGAAEKLVISACGPSLFYCQCRNSCGDTDYERSVKHDTCLASTTTQFEALPGKTYYIKLYPTAVNTFDVVRTVPTIGLSCDHPITAVTGTNHADHTVNTDQWYVFTSTQSGTISLSSSAWGSTQVRLYHACSEEAYSIGNTSTEISANTPEFIFFYAMNGLIRDMTGTWISLLSLKEVILLRQLQR